MKFSKHLLTLLLLFLPFHLLHAVIIVIPPEPIRPPWPRPPHPGHFSFAPLEVESHRVVVEIRERVATTTVEEEYYNPNARSVEGSYILPLPQGAHIDAFSMDIDGKMRDAELLSADKAKELYEEIVRKMKDPALLEYADRGALKMRIFPIEGNARKKVKITYTQLLKKDGELVDYIYPLGTGKFSSARIKEVSVKVTLEGKESLKTLYCPSHAAEIRREGEHRAVIGFEGKDIRPDMDFKVVFSRSRNPLGIDLAWQRVKGEDGSFMLLASPGIVARPEEIQPKDIVFVLDTSGSMMGAKMEQAKKALQFCLANLAEKDRFEIVRFSTEAETLFGKLQPASGEYIERAEEFIKKLKPIGGTAIGEALEKSLRLREGDSVRPFYIIFLTDGQPTIGETREDPLVDAVTKMNTSNTRIFTFGVGTDVNTHLLDRIACETRAASQYVLPNEDLEVKLSSFYTKIAQPVLSDLTVEISNRDIRLTEMQPNALPDLFNGDVLTIFGRYSGAGETAVKIKGIFNGKPHEFAVDVTFPEWADGKDYIPMLWATRRVGWLLNEIRLRGESAELKEEVTRLARQYGIVTPYTAYLILEDERRRDVPVARQNFREMAADRPAMEGVARWARGLAGEAKDESARSGRDAVYNAMEAQAMAGASAPMQGAAGVFKDGLSGCLAKSNASDPGRWDRKLGYRAEQTKDYAGQVQTIQGRSFYLNGNVWSDSTAQGIRDLKDVKVAFASTTYFELMKEHPEMVAWLSLGTEMDIVIGKTLYQIREE